MTTLVTGGAGYIGSHTVRAMREQGRDVVVLDTLELGHRAAVLDTPLVVGDVADEPLVARLCADHGVDSCIHFAAYKNVGESMQSPGKYWLNNVAGTVHLVEALLRAGVDRLVFSSSCSVYGTPAQVPVTEDAPVRPESVYAESKASMERVLRWYDATSALRSVSLRYFNAAGASSDALIGEDWTHSLNLVPVVMKAALGQRDPVQVFGDDYPTPDGTCIRDYIHVMDLAEGHVAALRALEAAQDGTVLTVNLGTGRGHSVLELVETFERVNGIKVPRQIAARRPGDAPVSYADCSKAKALLGWEARRNLEDMCRDSWRWQRQNPDGFA